VREGVDSEDDLEKGAIDDDAEAEELHVHPAAIRGALGPSRFLAGPVAATRTDRSMMGDLGNLVTFGDKRQETATETNRSKRRAEEQQLELSKLVIDTKDDTRKL
jgi:hypothetical protein